MFDPDAKFSLFPFAETRYMALVVLLLSSDEPHALITRCSVRLVSFSGAVLTSLKFEAVEHLHLCSGEYFLPFIDLLVHVT